jgi:hypothetical protein
MALALATSYGRAVEALPEDEDGLLGVGDLCRMFEDSEEASDDARQASQRDRDYYDGIQLTADQKAELSKRGQPEVVTNLIRVKVNYLIGLEKQQRTLPRGLPRTPLHENDAHAVSDALKYVADDQDYHSKRSGVWRNMLIEGAGAIAVRVEQKASKPDAMLSMMGTTAMTPLPTEWDVKLVRYAWDRFFADPHSCQLDYSDANYLGGVLWMDEVDAIAMYGDTPEVRDILSATMQSVSLSDTYDDTPKWSIWADRKRRRVRIVQIWVKRDDEWFFAEFTKGGILKSGPSPYTDENGKTECELIAQSAYVDRDNNRYGEVRAYISPQDEINKRGSKALHILNTSQIVFEEGAVQDEDKARTQAARPDGAIKLNPGGMEKFKFNTRTDMANGQFQLLQEAKANLSVMGPNASQQGDQGKEASGRAILASQQGGMIETGDMLDNLRHFDKRVFRAIWSRIRQFWTAPKWIRVTDDERNVRFAPLNGAVGNDGQVGPRLGDLDVDIIIDDAPDGVAPAIEQFQALVELKKFDAGNELSFRTLLQAMPNLRNKDKLLEEMDKRHEAQGQQPNPEVMAMQAKLQMEQQQAQTALQLKQAELQIEQEKAQAQIAADRAKAEQEMMIQRERAAQEMEIERVKAEQQQNLARLKAGADIELRREAAARKPEFTGAEQ